MSIITHSTFKTASVFFLAASAVAFASFAHAADARRKNPTSKLYVADVEGLASINTGEKIEDLTKKSVHAAEGVVLETTPNANNAIVLSNGTGIAFDPDTRLEMKRFLQEPFSPNRTDLEVEPSVSQTAAFLPRGTVGLCTSKMVAGSTMTYTTRHATVAIRGRKVVIETSDKSTIVSLLEGDVTVRGDLMAGGQSLKPGQQAIITRNSNSEPPVITIQPIPEADMSRLSSKVTQACMARKTVYFEVSERKNQNSNDGVFNQENPVEDVLVPVEVLPGTIPPPSTVSPYTITPGA
ncbi:MAG TPA: FecR domain-containing protein [Rariglobus sp.]